MLVAINSTWLHTPLGSIAVEILPHIEMRKNDRLTNEVVKSLYLKVKMLGQLWKKNPWSCCILQMLLEPQ